MPTTDLPLSRITLDDACQPRAVTNQDLAGEYAEAMAHGAVFPPVVVFSDGEGRYFLADGYHRWHAAKIAGWQRIGCDVRPGGRREAILHSVGANAEHGWRRSNDDKRRAVQTLLADPEWSSWSDREIARRCGVDGKTVAALRLSAELPQIDPERPSVRKVERNGTVYEQATSGINADRRRPEPEPEYTIYDDPRQVTADEVIQRFDAKAADLRLRITSLIQDLLDMPSPNEAIDAWVAGRGEALSIPEVRQAADWLGDFADRHREMEPRRLEALRAMQAGAKELTSGTQEPAR